MSKITVWTKQNKAILKELEETGRHICKKEYIGMDLQEHIHLVLEVYDWLVKHTTNREYKPADAEYPVWVSTSKEATMLPDDNSVILELSIDPEMIAKVNIFKWGTILNYSYIAADEKDAARHRELLEQYGVSDTKAYMSQFYPQIKREIIASWDRLFDENVSLVNDSYYGNIWEIKKEWIVKIIE